MRVGRRAHLVCIPNCAIQAIDVSDEENTQEQENAIDETKMRGDDLNPSYTGAIFTQQMDFSGGWIGAGIFLPLIAMHGVGWAWGGSFRHDRGETRTAILEKI